MPVRFRRGRLTASRRYGLHARHTIAHPPRASGTAEDFASRLRRIRTWRELDGEVVVIAVGGVPLKVEVAVSAPRRTRGLSAVDHLADDRGMLFVHPPGRGATYWMKDMRFAIDIIWCLGERVVQVTPAAPLPPAETSSGELQRYRIRRDSDMVIEVPANWAADHAIGPGSSVRLAELCEPRSGCSRPAG